MDSGRGRGPRRPYGSFPAVKVLYVSGLRSRGANRESAAALSVVAAQIGKQPQGDGTYAITRSAPPPNAVQDPNSYLGFFLSSTAAGRRKDTATVAPHLDTSSFCRKPLEFRRIDPGLLQRLGQSLVGRIDAGPDVANDSLCFDFVHDLPSLETSGVLAGV